MAHHTFISSMKENFLLAAAEPGNSVLCTFLIYILGVLSLIHI